VIERSRVRFEAVPPLGATLGKLFTHVPLFTKQYKLVPASAGGKVHHRSGVGYAIRRNLRLAANRCHSNIVLTYGCRCTVALM